MGKRKLTEGERQLAYMFFRDGIQYDRVNVYDCRVYPFWMQDRNRAMSQLNNISFPGKTYHADFSQDDDIIRQSVWFHEMVHVWQLHSKICHPLAAYISEKIEHGKKYKECYLYKLEPGKDLLEYDYEQQASMLQDYFLLKMYDCETSYKNRRQNTETGPALMKLYEDALARFIEDPTYNTPVKKELQEKRKIAKRNRPAAKK